MKKIKILLPILFVIFLVEGSATSDREQVQDIVPIEDVFRFILTGGTTLQFNTNLKDKSVNAQGKVIDVKAFGDRFDVELKHDVKINNIENNVLRRWMSQIFDTILRLKANQQNKALEIKKGDIVVYTGKIYHIMGHSFGPVLYIEEGEIVSIIE